MPTFGDPNLNLRSLVVEFTQTNLEMKQYIVCETGQTEVFGVSSVAVKTEADPFQSAS